MGDHDTQEAVFVQHFLACEELVYKVEKQSPGKGPDFLLRGPNALVGLELTRVHRPREAGHLPRQQMEGIREALLQGAQREWEARSLPAVEVHCHFNHLYTPFRSELPSVVGRLVDAVAAALPGPGAYKSLRSLEMMAGEKLPRAVHTANVYQYDGSARTHWLGSDAEWGAELDVPLVQERINAKNRKIELYRPEEWPVWLLVVMDSRRFSGMMHVPEVLLCHEFSSFFDKTYLLDVLNRQTWQLRHQDRSGRFA